MQIALSLPYPVSAKFGKLTVLSRTVNDRFGRTQWNVACDCGNARVVAMFRMTSGHTKSCGCIRGKANRTHGMRGTPTHNTWCAMKQRCLYPSAESYADYGGRGIGVCERWMSFENFFADMGEKPEDLTIERDNTDGNYEPGNCRWATASDQSRNRRSTVLVERAGVKLCVKDWAIKIGMNPDRIYGKIRRGATPSAALEWAISCAA